MTNVISTFAGTGVNGFSGDGGQATAAQIPFPRSVTIDVTNNLVYIADFGTRIRSVNRSTGIITTVAGNGQSGQISTTPSPALSSPLNTMNQIVFDKVRNIIYIGTLSRYLYAFNVAAGTIAIVAGTGFSSSYYYETNPTLRTYIIIFLYT